MGVVINLTFIFYRATLRYSAVYAIATCPSVCLSVRHKPKFYPNGWNIVTQITPCGSLWVLAFWRQRSSRWNYDAPNKCGVAKFATFDKYIAVSRKRYKTHTVCMTDKHDLVICTAWTRPLIGSWQRFNGSRATDVSADWRPSKDAQYITHKRSVVALERRVVCQLLQWSILSMTMMIRTSASDRIYGSLVTLQHPQY